MFPKKKLKLSLTTEAQQAQQGAAASLANSFNPRIRQ